MSRIFMAAPVIVIGAVMIRVLTAEIETPPRPAADAAGATAVAAPGTAPGVVPTRTPATRQPEYPQRSGPRLALAAAPGLDGDEPAVSTAALEPDEIEAAIRAITVDGLALEEVRVLDDRVTVAGYAKTNPQVAAFMRSLDDSVGAPELRQAVRSSRGNEDVSEFLIEIAR